MLNCIRLYWCRRAMTMKCDLCNSSCWMLGLWGTPASRCPLCAAVWRRSPMCAGSADCRWTLQGKKSSQREERQGRGRLLRCLMWSGSVRIPKPSPALRSFTCKFLLRFIVCYIPFFFLKVWISSFIKYFGKLRWTTGPFFFFLLSLPLSRVISIKFQQQKKEDEEEEDEQGVLSISQASCPSCTKSAWLQNSAGPFLQMAAVSLSRGFCLWTADDTDRSERGGSTVRSAVLSQWPACADPLQPPQLIFAGGNVGTR